MASSEVPTHHGDDTLYQEESLSPPADDVFAQLQSTSPPTMSSTNNIPPPPPCITYQRFQASRTTLSNLSRIVPKETVETWDKLFKEGLGADTYVQTGSGNYIYRLPAHSSVLAVASPVIAELLCQSTVKQGKIYLIISSVHLLPNEAVYMFIRFLYSSCYEEEEMNKYVLHLMIMSHTYSVPSLKRVCVEVLEQGWINKDNVIDVFQIAKDCDAARICFVCVSMIIKDFEAVSLTDGWIVMRITHPFLEQELIDVVLEADTRRQERETKLKERKVYLELYEAMEALVHIYREGCKTIGPRHKPLKGSQTVCNFPACKPLEGVLRHFLGCTSRAWCYDCKRVWQLLQLHSCLCDDSDSCKVPLCQNFKVKMKNVSKREESKWRLLVENIIRAKNSLGPFSSRLI